MFKFWKKKKKVEPISHPTGVVTDHGNCEIPMRTLTTGDDKIFLAMVEVDKSALKDVVGNGGEWSLSLITNPGIMDKLSKDNKKEIYDRLNFIGKIMVDTIIVNARDEARKMEGGDNMKFKQLAANAKQTRKAK